MTRPRLWLPGALLLSLAACGLKGSLEMPERSTNVVIRGPQDATTGPGVTDPAEAPAPPVPGREAGPATKPAAPDDDDRQPPPPLPGGNQGSASGG